MIEALEQGAVVTAWGVDLTCGAPQTLCAVDARLRP